MEKSDFQIGCEFYTGSGKWRCTDIGSRVIVAIKLDGKHDPSWYEVPYLVEEVVFDEHDLGGCDLEDSFVEFRNADRRNRLVPCTRCGCTDISKRGVIVAMDLRTAERKDVVVRVCTDCKTDQDKSCIQYGKQKRIRKYPSV